MMRIRVSAIFTAACFFFSGATGQKLAFQNFNTDKGLIQTQVYSITQDQQRHLWIGTTAGIDRFDGTTFKHFTKTEGLNSPAINCLYTAPNGYIWAGTLKGASCHNGRKIVNYPIENAFGSVAINAISSDEQNNIWALSSGGGIYRLVKDSFVKQAPPVAKTPASSLYKDDRGVLWVSFFQQGVYKWVKNQWEKTADIPLEGKVKVLKMFKAENAWYVFFDSAIAIYTNGSLTTSAPIPENAQFKSASNDKKGDIWLGTNKGLWVFNGKTLAVLAKHSANTGLSDNNILTIYNDVEGNLWIGTDADGLFKFSDGVFGRYDERNGLKGNVIMGIASTTEGNLYIGSREGGLVQYNITTKAISPIDVAPLGKGGINCLANDKTDHLFVGKLNGGVFEYYKGRWKEVLPFKQVNQSIANAIVCQDDKVWIAANTGCYFIRNGVVNQIEGINGLTLSVLPLPNKEVLIGAYDGLYLFTGIGKAQKIRISELQNLPVLCMASKGEYVLIGTFDDGLYYWNRTTDKIYRCNSGNGLDYNQVFNIFIDSKQRTWVGSGTSIQQITFTENNGRFEANRFTIADGYENAESNLNAMVEDKNGQIWIGTAKGAFVFNGGEPVQYKKGPYVVIQQVSVSDSSLIGNEKQPWYPLPTHLNLPYSKNNISFTVKGIFMKHPEAVKYACQLVGYDNDFSPIVDQTFFNYQNLDPGEYTFRVKAYTTTGLQSENIAEYSFTVATPFYKTTWFLLLMILTLLLTGGVVQFLFMRARQRKQQQQAIIRREEQQAIRLRTSEDFHDELGNKLTRISLLTDILQKKTNTEDTEKNKIIAQIKENVLALYGGTRDIIWSLSSGSDNLLETIKRIGQFGEELFHGSGVDFDLYGADKVDPTIVLPMDYSRNILMIFKESLNNSLKHAQCTRVTITVETVGNTGVTITHTDNGKGFDEVSVQKGNGLNNIRRRADRINAGLAVAAAENDGVSITLLLKIPPKG